MFGKLVEILEHGSIIVYSRNVKSCFEVKKKTSLPNDNDYDNRSLLVSWNKINETTWR